MASSRSWVAASSAIGVAPKERTSRCRRSSSRPDERSDGVRYQAAPSNRSARAFSTPLVSAPATGWPPTKRSSATASTTWALVEPTSLTTHSGPAASRAAWTWVASEPTGPQAKQASVLSRASSSERATTSMAPALAGGLQALRAAPVAHDLAATLTAGRQADRAADQPDTQDGDAHAQCERRARTAPASSSSTPSVLPQSMHASVTDWP